MKHIKRKPMFRSMMWTAIVIAAALVITACPKKIQEAASYDFAPPTAEWIPERSEEGTLIFRRKEPPMGIMVGTECDSNQKVPLIPLSRHLFIGFENRKEISRETAKVDGHDAAVVVMSCALDGTPLKVKAYTLKAEGCVYDLAYFAEPDNFAVGLEDFENFVSQFKVGKN